MSRKPSLPKNLLSGLYRPEFVAGITPLNEAEFDPLQALAEAEQGLRTRIEQQNTLLANDINRPLNAAEAESLNTQIAALQEEIATTRARIAKLRTFIDEQARPSGGKEVTFSVPLKGRRALQRAIIHVFGSKTSELTYSMYLEAKEAKRQIEEEEAEAYTKGQW